MDAINTIETFSRVQGRIEKQNWGGLMGSHYSPESNKILGEELGRYK